MFKKMIAFVCVVLLVSVNIPIAFSECYSEYLDIKSKEVEQESSVEISNTNSETAFELGLIKTDQVLYDLYEYTNLPSDKKSDWVTIQAKGSGSIDTTGLETGSFDLYQKFESVYGEERYVYLHDTSLDITITTKSAIEVTTDGAIDVTTDDGSDDVEVPEADIAEDLEGDDLNEKIDQVADKILRQDLEEYDPADSSKLLKATSQTIDRITEVDDEKPMGKEKVDKTIKLMELSSKLTHKLNDRNAAISNGLKNLDTIEKLLKRPLDTKEDKEEFKKSAVKLTQVTLDKINTVQVVQYQETIGKEKIEVDIKPDTFEKHIEEMEKLSTIIEEKADEAIGKELTQKIERNLTVDINVDKDVKQYKTKVYSDTMNELRNRNFSGIILSQSKTAVKLKPDHVLSDESPIEIRYTKEDKLKDELPTDVEVVDEELLSGFEIYRDDVEEKQLRKPVDLMFELSDNLIEKLSEEELNRLTVYRFNDDTSDWEPVGGIYDPIKKRIVTKRSTLSQYTVLKSLKEFNDVENSWAKNEINELLGKGIINETAAFHPSDSMTRGEFTAWVVKAYNLDSQEYSSPFNDMSEDHPYYNEIAAAYNSDIIQGRSSFTFAPDEGITKEEMATVLANALDRIEEEVNYDNVVYEEDIYEDNEAIADWSQKNIALLDELNIINSSDNVYKPKDIVIKEEAADIFNRFYN